MTTHSNENQDRPSVELEIELSSDPNVAPEPELESSDGKSGTVGCASREQIRPFVERFARIRSAHRALPNAVGELKEADARDHAANEVRLSLERLTSHRDGDIPSAEDLDGAFQRIDRSLDDLAIGLLDRFDRLPIAELRGSMPMTVGSRRKEVIALVEEIVAERTTILERLAKLEYIITILSTEESDGERKIVHDPVTITQGLADLANDQAVTAEADEVAVELYQAASADATGDELAWVRSIRARKRSLGLTCLVPTVLRAIVTYNVRIFNRLSSTTDRSSCDADQLLLQLFGDHKDEIAVDAGSPFNGIDDDDEVWSRIGAPEEQSSVFDNAGIQTLIHALRRRLIGVPIGSCTSEQVALALDVTRLEELETEAIIEESPSSIQQVVRCTALAGLLVRDLGVVRSQLPELGIEEAAISRTWLLELDQVFARLIAEKVGDVDQYALVSKLSGIKAKHLLAPLSAIRERIARAPAEDPVGRDEAAQERNQIAREALRKSGPSMHEGAHVWAGKGLEKGAFVGWLSSNSKNLAVAAVPILLALAVFGVNRLTMEPSSISTLGKNELAKASDYLTSAYRNEDGRGSMFFGRVSPDFEKLPPTRRVAVANEMVGRFTSEGIREAMIYDPRGKLQIHYANGQLRRPKLSTP